MNSDMNSEANVLKNDNATPSTDKLSIKERGKLSKAVLGFGKMKVAVSFTGLSKDTIAKAKAGMDIKPETAETIRTFLNSL
jgi:hypothetical protein